MTTDKTPATLATAKHGGCVQLGDGLPPLPKTGYVTGGDFGHEAHNAFTPEQMQDYARAAIAAALSAQPSPGGQGDARRQWLEIRGLAAGIVKNLKAFAESSHKAAWCGALDDSLSFADQIEKDADAAYAASLAARQPVGSMSSEASGIARGMVLHCIEQRLCMGMDEGFASFDPYVEHPFVQELREFADGSRQPVGEPVANPIHQLRKADGLWVDQDKHSYDYNVAQGHRADLRVVYAAPTGGAK